MFVSMQHETAAPIPQPSGVDTGIPYPANHKPPPLGVGFLTTLLGFAVAHAWGVLYQNSMQKPSRLLHPKGR